MTPEQFRRVKELYLAARDMPAEERRSFLEQVGPEDAVVCEEVERMLAQPEETLVLRPLSRIAASAGAARGMVESAVAPGERIGRYRVERVIGEGGMGVVLLAEQTEPVRRRVAIKLIKLGMDTRGVIARFESERQALAMMDHPNIAKVLDAGATAQGRPYFVMEYVEGPWITRYCDEHRLSIGRRLDLFRQICSAVQHAHQKGIIHRDLKPSNVLVAGQDGTPLPKIIDFGVAKAIDQRLTERTVYTAPGQFIGTPEYMSPEQAGLTADGPGNVDTRSDVYSLGVILYELLVGVLPYGQTQLRGRGLADIERVIREESPPRPSTRLRRLTGEAERPSAKPAGGAAAAAAVSADRVAEQRGTTPRLLHRQIGGDLDWITMKALEKDRGLRYAGPAELAADIERYVEHKPVSAGPPSTVYRVRKFVRRRPGLVAGGAAVVLALAAVGAALTMSAIARTRADAARRLTNIVTITAAHEALLDDRGAAARLHLDAVPRESRDWEWRYLDAACDESLVILRGHTDEVRSAVFNPANEQIVASGSVDGTVRLWDVGAGAELYRLEGHDGAVNAVAFSPNGRLLASAGADKTVRLWEVPADGQPTQERILEGHTEEVRSVAFDTNGTRLVSGGMDDTVRIWDPLTGEQQKTLRLEGVEKHAWGDKAGVWSVAFGPQPGQLAAASWSDMSVRLWDLGASKVAWRGREHREGVSSLAFSPDGRCLATGSQDHTVGVWDVATGDCRRVLRGHSATVMAVDFGPEKDTPRLASGAIDATVRIWNALTGEQVRVLRGHQQAVRSVRFSGDGRRIVSASADKTVRIWNASSDNDAAILGKAHDEVWAMAFNPDGKRLATGMATADPTVRIWDVDTHELLAVLKNDAPDPVLSVAFSPNGKLLASGSYRGVVSVWDAASGQRILSPPQRAVGVADVAFSPDGRCLAQVARAGSPVVVWRIHAEGESPSAEELWSGQDEGRAERSVAFSPDGSYLAWTSTDNAVRMCDAATGRLLKVLAGHEDNVLTLAFSPDGRSLASGSADKTVRIWDTESGNSLLVLRGCVSPVEYLAFSPDGARLAAASTIAYLWDARTGEELLRLRGHKRAVRSVAFSPDGTRLATGGGDWDIRLWDTVPYRVRHQEREDIINAASQARPIVDAAFWMLGDWRLAAESIGQATSLPEAVRHAALNDILVRTVGGQKFDGSCE